MFVRLGISQQERRNQDFLVTVTLPFHAEIVVEYVKEVNEMFHNLISKHPVFGEFTDSYQAALLSVTADLFGTGKRSRQKKLSKTRLVDLVTGAGDINKFSVVLFEFFKSAEAQVCMQN